MPPSWSRACWPCAAGPAWPRACEPPPLLGARWRGAAPVRQPMGSPLLSLLSLRRFHRWAARLRQLWQQRQRLAGSSSSTDSGRGALRTEAAAAAPAPPRPQTIGSRTTLAAPPVARGQALPRCAGPAAAAGGGVEGCGYPITRQSSGGSAGTAWQRSWRLCWKTSPWSSRSSCGRSRVLARAHRASRQHPTTRSSRSLPRRRLPSALPGGASLPVGLMAAAAPVPAALAAGWQPRQNAWHPPSRSSTKTLCTSAVPLRRSARSTVSAVRPGAVAAPAAHAPQRTRQGCSSRAQQSGGRRLGCCPRLTPGRRALAAASGPLRLLAYTGAGGRCWVRAMPTPPPSPRARHSAARQGVLTKAGQRWAASHSQHSHRQHRAPHPMLSWRVWKQSQRGLDVWPTCWRPLPPRQRQQQQRQRRHSRQGQELRQLGVRQLRAAAAAAAKQLPLWLCGRDSRSSSSSSKAHALVGPPTGMPCTG